LTSNTGKKREKVSLKATSHGKNGKKRVNLLMLEKKITPKNLFVQFCA
jgi:hypothetical protein